MERITVFKLCFALGVSVDKLKADYPVEYRIAERTSYFGGLIASVHCRNLAMAYFAVLSRYPECTSELGFARVLGESGVTLIGEAIPATGESALEYVNRVGLEHNLLLLTVHCELESRIPVDIFTRILNLPELESSGVAQLRFLLKNNSNPYNIYFPDYELLNVCVSTMFHDDMSLRDRLSLLTGERLEAIYDTSSLACSVREYVQRVFLSKQDFQVYRDIYAYNGYPARLLDLQRFLQSTSLSTLKIGDKIELEEVPRGSLVITNDCRWVNKAAKRYPYVDFALIMPVEPYFYRRARERISDNIYLVGSI